jgi:hypothetical protein
LQLKIFNIVANDNFLLQNLVANDNFILVKCHKTNVCTPMHWELSKNTKCVIRNLIVLRYFNVTNFELLLLFAYFGFLFNFTYKDPLNSISPGSYVVLSVNPLQNKVNSTYDHCLARCMYEFKYFCNSWNFLELLLTL